MAKIGIIDIRYANATVADKCPKCSKMNEISITLYQSAFVIGFPLFPTAKKNTFECAGCRNTIPLGLAPPFAIRKYNELYSTRKPSPWFYSFSYLIIVVMIWASVSMVIDGNKFEGYIDQAKVGDVYEIRTKKQGLLSETNYYTYWKVVSVNSSEVGVKECLYEATVDKRHEIQNKPEDEKWMDEVTYHSKASLKAAIESFSNTDSPYEISDIERAE